MRWTTEREDRARPETQLKRTTEHAEGPRLPFFGNHYSRKVKNKCAREKRQEGRRGMGPDTIEAWATLRCFSLMTLQLRKTTLQRRGRGQIKDIRKTYNQPPTDACAHIHTYIYIYIYETSKECFRDALRRPVRAPQSYKIPPDRKASYLGRIVCNCKAPSTHICQRTACLRWWCLLHEFILSNVSTPCLQAWLRCSCTETKEINPSSYSVAMWGEDNSNRWRSLGFQVGGGSQFEILDAPLVS